MALQCQDTGSIPSLAQRVKGPSGVGCTSGLDLSPGPETPKAKGWVKRKKKKKKKTLKSLLGIFPRELITYLQKDIHKYLY